MRKIPELSTQLSNVVLNAAKKSDLFSSIVVQGHMKLF